MNREGSNLPEAGEQFLAVARAPQLLEIHLALFAEHFRLDRL